MNIYFLVEGKRTERKVYPAWLAYLLPELQRVQSYDEVFISHLLDYLNLNTNILYYNRIYSPKLHL